MAIGEMKNGAGWNALSDQSDNIHIGPQFSNDRLAAKQILDV